MRPEEIRFGDEENKEKWSLRNDELEIIAMN